MGHQRAQNHKGRAVDYKLKLFQLVFVHERGRARERARGRVAEGEGEKWGGRER